MKMYCYKVKWPLLKVKENNAYARAKIEEFGFEPMFEQFEHGEEGGTWIGGWAKKISIPHDTKIGAWLKKNVESIYKAEKDNKDSKWIKEIKEAGYEFDKEGKLVENAKATEPTSAELCIMKDGSYHGTLFINIGGAMEIYDTEILDECCPGDVNELVVKDAIYKKRFRDGE